MCRGLGKLFSLCARQLLDTSYLLRFKDFKILDLFFLGSLNVSLGFLFSPNPRHIKELFKESSNSSQVAQALSKLCSSKL